MRAIATSGSTILSVTGQCRTCGAMMSVELRPTEDARTAHVIMPTGQGAVRYFQLEYLTSELRYNASRQALTHHAKCAAPPHYCGGAVALLGGFAPVEHDTTQQQSLLLKDTSLHLGERSA